MPAFRSMPQEEESARFYKH